MTRTKIQPNQAAIAMLLQAACCAALSVDYALTEWEACGIRLGCYPIKGFSWQEQDEERLSVLSRRYDFAVAAHDRISMALAFQMVWCE